MSHAPKIAALQAYAEDVLSAAGHARVERHLAGCALCREALATIRVYRDTLDDIRTAPAPELDWSKMELALAREARRTADGIEAAKKRGLPREGVIAIVIAAAAVLALALWPRSPGAPVVARESTPSHEVVAEETPAPELAPPAAPSAVAVVTLAAGHARAIAGEQDRALDVGSEIFAGDHVVTDEGAALHASVRDDAAIALAGATEVALGSAPEGDEDGAGDGAGDGALAIALVRGTVRAEVDPVASESRFVVLAAEYRFEAQATRFELMLDPAGEVRLGVATGEVSVHHPDGSVVVVRAPGTWSSAGGAGEGAPEIAPPYGRAPEARAWPVVRVEREGIVRWEIGDVTIDGIGSLAMRAPPGELAIAGFDAEGRAFRTVAMIGADGLSLGADALVPEPPRVREGFIEEDDVHDVVVPSARRIQQCYEHALREHSDLADLGERAVTVHVHVAFDGSVSRVQLAGDDLPAPIAECVQTQASRWVFPPPQGGSFARIEVPFRLRPRP